MPSSKSKKRRDASKYPGLERHLNTRIRQEHIDQDYVDKLSPSEKQWLSNFNEEYYGGKFDHEGRILHKTKKKKRECYSRNNAQNRCVMGVKKATGYLVHTENIIVEKAQDDSGTIDDAFVDVVVKEQAMELYMSDYTKREIAEKLNLPIEYIKQILGHRKPKSSV